jgi:Alw26I/Eco31I/Esp3I family type II restriction m6 adenine DNA methyltransferase
VQEQVARKQLGAYHTPDELSLELTHLVFRSYEQSLLEQLKQSIMSSSVSGLEAILRSFYSLSVCDPMAGEGVFLLNAQDAICEIQSKVVDLIEESGLYPQNDELSSWLELDVRSLRKRIATKNLYGVDINPNSIEKIQSKLASLTNQKSCFNLGIGDSLTYDIGHHSIEISSDTVRSDIAALIRSRNAKSRSEEKVHQSSTDLSTKLGVSGGAFCWFSEFPEIFFDEYGYPKDNPGFDIILGNPPWEVVKPNDNEFFSSFQPDYRTRNRKSRDMIRNRLLSDKRIRRRYDMYRARLKIYSDLARSGAYNFQYSEGVSSGDVNLYKIGFERFYQLTMKGGWIGVVTPLGLATDAGTKGLRQMMFSTAALTEGWGFSPKAGFFDGTDQCAAIFVLRKGRQSDRFVFASDLNSVEDLERLRSNLEIFQTPEFVKRISPSTFSIPSVRTSIDKAILEKMHSHPPLLQQIDGTWNIKMSRGLDETNERHMFRASNTGTPLYKGRDLYPFLLNPPSIWVDPNLYDPRSTDSFCDRVAWRDVARPNLKRRLFSAIIPKGSTLGNSLNYLIADDSDANFYIMGLLNTLTLDYRVRLTTSNSHINQYVVAQLPLPRASEGSEFRRLVDLSENSKDWKTNEGIMSEEEREINAIAASLFGFSERQFEHILKAYQWLGVDITESILQYFRKEAAN